MNISQQLNFLKDKYKIKTIKKEEDTGEKLSESVLSQNNLFLTYKRRQLLRDKTTSTQYRRDKLVKEVKDQI